MAPAATDKHITLDVEKALRELEEQESIIPRSSKRSRTLQQKFRDRLIERDTVCVVSSLATFEAAHIVPYSLSARFPEVWERHYQRYCLDPNDGIDDVRNGLLLSPTLHKLFDSYLFTIVFMNGVYRVKKSGLFPTPDLEEKELQFNGDRTRWPAPELLAYHNDRFEKKRLEAAAEPKDSERQDSSGTLTYNFEALGEHQRKWIEDLASASPELNTEQPREGCVI